MQRVRLLQGAGLLLLTTYLLTYVSLSRRGFAEADRYGLKGFYYLTYRDTDAWRFGNRACTIFYWPLNAIDRLVGRGRYPGGEPCGFL